MENLLEKIEQHLTASNTAPTTFGEKVLNNRNFVFNLRSGKANPTMTTVNKILSAIAENEAVASQ